MSLRRPVGLRGPVRLRPVSLRRIAPLAIAALASVFATDARAQNKCDLVYQTGNWISVGAEGQRVINAGGPLYIQCTNGEQLRADSAVVYEGINEFHLFRRVDYQDPGRSLTSDYATYNGNTGRLWATGSVVFTDKNRGSTLRGPNLEYFRAAPGRPEAQAIATERPHLTVVPRSGSRNRDPMEVDADRITTVGENHVNAEGNVVIEGKEMDAWGQTAYYDATQERMELRTNARAKGERYDLTGDYIEADLAEGSLERVLSRGNARLIEERMRVTGPQLQLFFARDSLQRLVSGHSAGTEGAAGGTGRSVALARGFRMEADSLEALTPGQRIRQVIAIGTAEGQAWDTLRAAGPSPADTTAPDTVAGLALGERDLIFADTITGFFAADSAGAVPPRGDSAAAAGDTAGADTTPAAPAPGLVRPPPSAQPDSANAELERMLAVGSARSLYRLRPSREEQQRNPNGKVGINYVIADTIDLAFTEGEVDIATVRGLKRGVYLDPLPNDTTRRDSTARDTLPRDTSAVAAANRPAPATVDATAPAQGGPPSAPPASPAVPAAPVPTTPASATTTTPERRAPGGRR